MTIAPLLTFSNVERFISLIPEGIGGHTDRWQLLRHAITDMPSKTAAVAFQRGYISVTDVALELVPDDEFVQMIAAKYPAAMLDQLLAHFATLGAAHGILDVCSQIEGLREELLRLVVEYGHLADALAGAH